MVGPITPLVDRAQSCGCLWAEDIIVRGKLAVESSEMQLTIGGRGDLPRGLPSALVVAGVLVRLWSVGDDSATNHSGSLASATVDVIWLPRVRIE